MGEFLLELFSEEIPARMQEQAIDDLNRLVVEGLKKHLLAFESSSSCVTPHRLCVVVTGLIENQPDVRDERRGPRIDAPDAAIQGFLNSVGLDRNDLEERETKKGNFLFAVTERVGEKTTKILPQIIENSIREMPWPKSMRWGHNSFRWVRPLHHILAIFDGKKLEGQFDLGIDVIKYTNMTRGHRFLASQHFEVASFLDYKQKLKEAFVVIDREERKSLIVKQSHKLANEQGIEIKNDTNLLDEVCGLVEWPNALIGKIPDAFMTVPAEALVCAMRSHQKYFALTTVTGDLTPHFITISNMPSDSKRDETILKGNEKVLNARLSDAKFFWDQDREVTLESRISALNDIKFYDKLGSIGEKMIRVEKLAAFLCKWVPNTNKKVVKRAAQLAKADLTTSMVGEFPELQGIMGNYYALNDGEPTEVCLAIKEHYSPQGPSDYSPKSPSGVVLSLADKLDTLAGFFAINEKPTGSKDPFALRRYAVGIIRLIMENSLSLPLEEAIIKSLSLYKKFANTNGLNEFIMGRLKVFLRNRGIGNDRVNAVFAVNNNNDVNKLVDKIEAIDIFLSSDDGSNLLIAYRRAANIFAIESKKDGVYFDSKPDIKLFQLEQERNLSETLARIEKLLPGLTKSGDFNRAIELLATLRNSIDSYFENVTVNSDKPVLRENRLKTLHHIVRIMNTIADFSLIEHS